MKINKHMINDFLSNKVNHNLLTILLVFMLGVIFKWTFTLGQGIVVSIIILVLVGLWYIRGMASGILYSSLSAKIISKVLSNTIKDSKGNKIDKTK